MPGDPLGSVPVLVRVPVLADPVPREAERVLAPFGLMTYAPPVFTPCARAPLGGLLLALPALAATGLLDTAHTVYGELPGGFYSLDTIPCASVLRALLGEARAEGATGIDPLAMGAGAGFGPRAGGQDDPPQDRLARRAAQGQRLDRGDGGPAQARGRRPEQATS